MTQEQKHTALRFSWNGNYKTLDGRPTFSLVVGQEPYIRGILSCDGLENSPTGEEAEFIVRACNEYYDDKNRIIILEERLKHVEYQLKQKSKHVTNLLRKKRDAAIAKAEGK